MLKEGKPKKVRRGHNKSIPGFGFVYQLSSGDRYVADFLVSETGKRKQQYAKTEKEAYELLQQAWHDQKQGLLATGARQKLSDYLPWWLEEVHRPNIRISTYVRHRTIIVKHILPTLGHVELKKLTPQQVQKLYAEKETEGLGKATVASIHKVLRNALKNAVKWNLVSQNVCDRVTASRAPKYKVPLLTEKQIKHLLEVANNHGYMSAFIRLAMMSGMRHGEMLGLRWERYRF